MYPHNGTLYPMLGVGAFMTKFWTGIVVGNELGLGCASLFIMGLLSACIGTVGVCELQRRDSRGLVPEASTGVPRRSRPRDNAVSSANRWAGRTSRGIPEFPERRLAPGPGG